MNISVNCAAKRIEIGDQSYLCRIGRAGFVDGTLGREGDQKTPLGDYRVRFGLYRGDRLPGPPPSEVTFHSILKLDGWCDDSSDPAYNRFIRLPYQASYEKLWREDCVYDIVLVIDHNDSPPEPDLGSAVFIHIAQPDDRQTLGCVALTPEVMLQLLKRLKTGTPIKIR